MKKNLKLLFDYIIKFHKTRFYILSAIILSSVFLEISSLAILALILSLTANPGMVNEYSFLKYLINFFNFDSNQEFIFIFIITGILFIILSTVFSIINLILTAKFSMKVGIELGQKLFYFYVNKNIMWHNKNNSSSLINKIVIECNRITMNIINPFSQFFYKFFLSISIITFLFLFNFEVTFYIILTVLLFYFFIFFFLRKKIKINGKNITNINSARLKLIQETFLILKELIIYKKKNYFLDKFNHFSHTLQNSLSNNYIYSILPKNLIEIFAYLLFVFLLVIFNYKNQQNYFEYISIFGIYLICFMKLLPSVQTIYNSLVKIQSEDAALENIKLDITRIIDSSLNSSNQLRNTENFSENIDSIHLKNIIFRYDQNTPKVIDKMSIDLKKNQIIGIVGRSGAGKSTLINILMGFLKFQNGEIKIKDREKAKIIYNSSFLQKYVSYVPQTANILDDTILNNITLYDDSIDLNKINEIIKSVGLENLVSEKSTGLNFNLGEKGVRFSPGQIQRLVLARALYQNRLIYILDEFTSSLDNETEKSILKSILKIKSNKIIIMIAHRVNVMKACDIIYYIDQGKILYQGNFEFLKKTSSSFNQLIQEFN